MLRTDATMPDHTLMLQYCLPFPDNIVNLGLPYNCFNQVNWYKKLFFSRISDY